MQKLKVIYEPSGAAREYAALALNLYNGCTHSCIYCYNNGRYSKPGEFFKSSKPRMGITGKIAADARYLVATHGDDCPEILISFIGDAYQPAEKSLGLTRLAIRTLIEHNLPFTILTKSSLIKRDFDLLAAHRSKFRVGMSFTTLDHFRAAEWEPEASSVIDRINVLFEAKLLGFKTWVSLEPVMCAADAVNVVKKINHLVDFWWIGKLNHMNPPEPVKWMEAMKEITEALEFHRCDYRFKNSFVELQV